MRILFPSEKWPVKRLDLSFSLRNASPGIDNIPMSLFSDNIVALADIISFVCNKSFEQGVFPERLAIAIIICLFKKGNINVVENYRAISLLVAFSKFLEKLVSSRLINYFLVNNLFTEAQFGWPRTLYIIS